MDFIQHVNTDNVGPPTRWDRLRWWWRDLKYHFPGGYQINQGYWKVKRYFFPARPRLLRAVGKDYRDLTWLIPHFLFESVIDFVEEEKPFERVVWPPEEEVLLRDLYDFVKVRMPAAEKEVADALDKWSENSKWARSFRSGDIDAAAEDSPTAEDWFKIHLDLEQKLETEKQAYLHKIVDFHGRMWT